MPSLDVVLERLIGAAIGAIAMLVYLKLAGKLRP